MKELILFSLKRRFMNKNQLILMIIMFAISGCLFFADKLISVFDSRAFNPMTIYLSHDLYLERDRFKEDSYYKLEEYKSNNLGKKEVKLSFADNEFVVISDYPLDDISKSYIDYLVSSYVNSYIKEDNRNETQSINVEYKAINSLDEQFTDRQNVAFLLITVVYFTALSYANSISSEVVYEKTGNILDMVLTSVSVKTHFTGKIISSWLTIIIQNFYTVMNNLFWYLMRVSFDGGKGLVKLMKQTGIINSSALSLKQFIRSLNSNSQFLVTIVCLFVFMILGILIIQLILAIISSYVTNETGANGIQAISYIILLMVYYLALYMNEPYALSKGLGKYLSFLPFFSMLFMPCRMMLNVVSYYEVVASMLISVVAIIFIVDFGLKFYEEGILDAKEKKEIEPGEIIKKLKTDIKRKRKLETED